MRALIALALAVAVGGCTSVKMVQRDGCWVRRTEKAFGQVREELGPCARTASPWSDDRLTRLVQECVAREDYRWHMRALAAWGRDEPPPAEREANVLATCASEAARAGFAENDALKNQLEAARERLAVARERGDELASDRERMRKRSELEHDRVLASHAKLAEALGEAAKKPSPPAVATATASSDGRAELDSKQRSERAEAPPAAPVAYANAAPWLGASGQPAVVCAPAAAEPVKPAAAKKPRKQKPVVTASAPECVPPATPAATSPAPQIAPAPEVKAGTAVAAPAPGAEVRTADERPATIGPGEGEGTRKVE